MAIPEVFQRSISKIVRNRCGEIAVENGYPRQFGYRIYILCFADDLLNWSKEEFEKHVLKLESDYPDIPSEEKRRIYGEASQVFGLYGKAILISLAQDMN